MNDTGLYCVIFHSIQYHSYLWKWEFDVGQPISSAQPIQYTRYEVVRDCRQLSSIEKFNGWELV